MNNYHMDYYCSWNYWRIIIFKSELFIAFKKRHMGSFEIESKFLENKLVYRRIYTFWGLIFFLWR